MLTTAKFEAFWPWSDKICVITPLDFVHRLSVFKSDRNVSEAGSTSSSAGSTTLFEILRFYLKSGDEVQLNN
jgi:hypothetical protein